jgi:F-type H+-transporting ATPase subunit gamma
MFMETMRDIKRRISSVKNTKKITRAMKMVAAAKLQNSQKYARDAKPFFTKTRKILSDVYKFSGIKDEHPLLKKSEGDKKLLIVISGDRGLCGAYNAKVIEEAENFMNEHPETEIYALGAKARDYFKRRDYDFIKEYEQIDDYPSFYFARQLTDEIIEIFKGTKFHQINVVYTHFESALTQQVKNITLLPIDSDEIDKELSDKGEKASEEHVDYIYEPSAKEILDLLLPKYVNNTMYSILLESKASEFGSRMTAMDNATENANEMIDDLTLEYNRARQASITKEITEIVGGAEALK